MKLTIWLSCVVAGSAVAAAEPPPPPKIHIQKLPQQAGTASDVVPFTVARTNVGLEPKSVCAKCHMQNAAPQTRELPGLHGEELRDLTVYPRYVLNGLGTVQNQALPAFVAEPEDHTRKMLKLPEGGGLVVTSICPAGEVGTGGLQINDIVLKANGELVGKPQQLDAIFATTDPVNLIVLRKGQQIELRREATKPERDTVYRLGIKLGTIESVVREQLKLDSQVKVFVNGIQDDSAAAEADIQTYDIILSLNDDPVPDIESIQKTVADSKGQPLKLKLLRDGQHIEVELAARKVETEEYTADAVHDLKYWIADDVQYFHFPQDTNGLNPVTLVQPPKSDLSRQIESLREEVQSLSKLIRQLHDLEAADEE